MKFPDRLDGKQPALLDIGDIIRAFFQIGGDVRGKQDGNALLCQLQKDLQQLLAGDGVQPAGRLVQDQQPGMVGKGQRQMELDFHSLGKLQQPLALLQLEPLQVPAVSRVIPLAVKGGRHGGDLPDTPALVVADAAGRVADLLFDLLLVRGKIYAEVANFTAIGMHQPQNGFEGRCFAGAVAADKSHDPSALQTKAHILQGKCRITFLQTADL